MSLCVLPLLISLHTPSFMKSDIPLAFYRVSWLHGNAESWSGAGLPGFESCLSAWWLYDSGQVTEFLSVLIFFICLIGSRTYCIEWLWYYMRYNT